MVRTLKTHDDGQIQRLGGNIPEVLCTLSQQTFEGSNNEQLLVLDSTINNLNLILLCNVTALQYILTHTVSLYNYYNTSVLHCI